MIKRLLARLSVQEMEKLFDDKIGKIAHDSHDSVPLIV